VHSSSKGSYMNYVGVEMSFLYVHWWSVSLFVYFVCCL
jgi:hypothetical protein